MGSTTLSLSLSLSISTTNPNPRPNLARPPKPNCRLVFKPFSSSSSSSSSDTEPLVVSYVSDPLRSGRFLGREELDKLELLEGFAYAAEVESGSVSVRAMREGETEETVALLAGSMVLPRAFVSVLKFLVKQYLVERRDVVPHAVTLLGLFTERTRRRDVNGGYEEEEDDEKLAGTVEVCFDKRGANVSPPTPTAPRNSPYTSNMTVREDLRRRGIGWHLLKAAEELISKMSSATEVYLHCRIIDTAPFNMYTKAGYNIVKTDNFLVLLTFQRRKHLMRKKLPVQESRTLDPDPSGSEEGLT